MSGTEDGFVPAVPRREKKEKKAKQPKQEKPQQQQQQQQPKQTKAPEAEKPAEQPNAVINERTVMCPICYNIGHRAEACPEKKTRNDTVYCIRCGKAGHRSTDCKVKTEKFECFFCGNNTHTYSQCPEREKILHVIEEGRKGQSSVICPKCGCVGHVGSNCKEPNPRRRICRRCGEEGHTVEECKKPEEDHSAFRLCYRCGEIGHVSDECKVLNVQHPDVCPLCGQIGHTVDNCPSDMPSGKPVEEKKHEKAPAKKTLNSSDLMDAEQFPSL